MRLISTLLSLISLIILVTFVTHNTETITLNLWPFDIQLSMATSFMALVFFALGCLFGSILLIPRLWRSSWQQKKLAKAVNKLEKNIIKNQTQQNNAEPSASPAFLQRLLHKPKGTTDDQ